MVVRVLRIDVSNVEVKDWRLDCASGRPQGPGPQSERDGDWGGLGVLAGELWM